MVLGFSCSATSFASSDGDSKVLAMLKRNPVVTAAVPQAKEFSGAKTCEYTVKSNELEQFEKGAAYKYSATITCNGREATGSVTVKGDYIASTENFQELDLSIFFAE